MKRVEIRVRDEAGKVISEQTLKLDIGAGRFHEIEQGKRNKYVSAAVFMICSPIRGPMEGVIHHELRVTYCGRESRCQQPGGCQAGDDQDLRYAVSNLHFRAGTTPCRTDIPAGESSRCII